MNLFYKKLFLAFFINCYYQFLIIPVFTLSIQNSVLLMFSGSYLLYNNLVIPTELIKSGLSLNCEVGGDVQKAAGDLDSLELSELAGEIRGPWLLMTAL